MGAIDAAALRAIREIGHGVNEKLFFPVLICLERREENRPFSGQQRQTLFGLNRALCKSTGRGFLTLV